LRRCELSKTVLELNGVNKFYGEDDARIQALKEATFSIKQGELLLVVGSSGSGKTTLLNMIGLLDKPTTGTILIDGIETTKLNDNQISSFRNVKLGFVFQFANLLPDLTVLENVLLPRNIQGSNINALNDAKKLLQIVGLEDQMYKRANKISGGQAQRAAVARSLVNKPSVVLADEPTGNLDTATAQNIVKLMKSMSKTLGQTFIIVTHDRHQFGDVDRILNVRDGWVIEGEEKEMEVLT